MSEASETRETWATHLCVAQRHVRHVQYICIETRETHVCVRDNWEMRDSFVWRHARHIYVCVRDMWDMWGMCDTFMCCAETCETCEGCATHLCVAQRHVRHGKDARDLFMGFAGISERCATHLHRDTGDMSDTFMCCAETRERSQTYFYATHLCVAQRQVREVRRVSVRHMRDTFTQRLVAWHIYVWTQLRHVRHVRHIYVSETLDSLWISLGERCATHCRTSYVSQKSPIISGSFAGKDISLCRDASMCDTCLWDMSVSQTCLCHRHLCVTDTSVSSATHIHVSHIYKCRACLTCLCKYVAQMCDAFLTERCATHVCVGDFFFPRGSRLQKKKCATHVCVGDSHREMHDSFMCQREGTCVTRLHMCDTFTETSETCATVYVW